MSKPSLVLPTTADKQVDLLERLLLEAKHGTLSGLAIVSCANGQLKIATEGDVAMLLIGAVQLQEQLRQLLFPGPNVVGSRMLSS